MNASVQSVTIFGEFQPNPVLVKGDGPPVVYLHGLLGQEWSGFLEGLSAGRRVYAPAHAGSDEPDELRHLNGMYDLVLYYDDLFEALGLGQVDLIGHSFGGMVAAEIAAAHPGRVRRLVLMDALGLWRDDAPVADHLLASPDKQAWLLLGDPASEAVRHRLALPEDPELKIKETLRRITSMASVTHFIWPIPERGLAKRLHRIRAKTLVLWGAADKLISNIYARDFATHIKSAHAELIPGAGHSPQFSDERAVLQTVRSFLS